MTKTARASFHTKSMPIILSVLVWASFVSGQTNLTLNFNSLPSAQGWNYFGVIGSSSPIETNIYQVDGTKLIQNTTGIGVNAGGYTLSNSFNPNLPFTITATLRVTNNEDVSESPPPSVFSILARSNVTNSFGFSLDTNMLAVVSSPPAQIQIDATQFHNYRVEATPGVGQKIYVDNVLVISTNFDMDSTLSPYLSIPYPYLLIGNDSGYEHGYAELSSFNFSQSPYVAIALYPGITIGGTVGQIYGIQSSTNLSETNGWIGVTNVQLSAPIQTWYDPQPDSLSSKFFRVVPGPISIP